MSDLTRRDFLGAASLTLAWPHSLEALNQRLREAQDPWAAARAAFVIPPSRIYLNVGTLGPQPKVVIDAVSEHALRVAQTVPPAVDWDELRTETAELLKCDPAGLVFPRNTTEGMNFVANGLELGPNDEIITTRHEHVGGLSCWQLVSRRRGSPLKQVELRDPTSPERTRDDILAALTPRTRVVSVSHVLFSNGLILPVREIVEHCRARGIITVIDGAHAPGLIPVDIQAIDPDFYAASPHKWLYAAQGTGLLYLRAEWRTKLWPTIASGDWDNLGLGAHRFNHLGTIDESRLVGLLVAIRFHRTIGHERIYARIHQLRAYLFEALAGLPRVTLKSPRSDQAGAGLVSFLVDGLPALQLQQKLGEHNIRTRVISEYQYDWMRLSASIYNTTDQIDQVVRLISRA